MLLMGGEIGDPSFLLVKCGLVVAVDSASVVVVVVVRPGVDSAGVDVIGRATCEPSA